MFSTALLWGGRRRGCVFMRFMPGVQRTLAVFSVLV